MDFKEYIGISQGRCHPLSIPDDRSQSSLCFAADANERRQVVQEYLNGLPRQITMTTVCHGASRRAWKLRCGQGRSRIRFTCGVVSAPRDIPSKDDRSEKRRMMAYTMSTGWKSYCSNRLEPSDRYDRKQTVHHAFENFSAMSPLHTRTKHVGGSRTIGKREQGSFFIEEFRTHP